MQPDFPPEDDPQVLQSEFDVPDVDGLADDALNGDSVELFDVTTMLPGTPCYGVACVEGIPDGSTPQRMWAPGSLVFAPTPFPLKFQPAEDDGHSGSMVSGRVDAMWRDGALIRWIGVMDSAGVVGREHERLIGGKFMTGVSIKADDLDEADVEYIYPAGPDPSDEVEVDGEVVEDVEGEADFHYPGRHNQATHGHGANGKGKASNRQKAAAAKRIKARGDKFLSGERSVDGAVVADGAEMMDMPRPSMIIYHHGRVRSLTGVAEAAFIECTVSLGESPFSPPMVPEASPLAELEALAIEAETPVPVAVPLVAAGYTITIPQLWPESWFSEPSPAEMAMVAGGAIHITPEGRVWGLLAPDGVNHRAYRAGPRAQYAPRGIDYSEWQNKACIVAGADGNAYKINAGTVTFGCGHASPVDPRRANPAWAAEHYENSCSVAMRARVGENRFGTWFAGGLNHGLTASSLEEIMGCALSGDWQGGKLKGALLVPVEGFPVAVTASVREKMGTLVASSVPIRFDAPPPPPSYDWVFDLVASATGRGPAAIFDELAAERFDELARERG
jgi:hypothetical protein